MSGNASAGRTSRYEFFFFVCCRLSLTDFNADTTLAVAVSDVICISDVDC